MLCVSLCLSLGMLPAAGVAGEKFSSYVGDDGQIFFPKKFRSTMVHLGSWFVPDGEASGFHDVFTEKSSLLHYRETGEFPDGATIVKELRSAKSGNYTTGAGVSHATASLKQWFVMIKDSKERFPDSAIWGDGWGWALFKPPSNSSNVATNYKDDCLGCHIPAKSTDWVYIEAYPVLSEED